VRDFIIHVSQEQAQNALRSPTAFSSLLLPSAICVSSRLLHFFNASVAIHNALLFPFAQNAIYVMYPV
jgi:hypothetical protein